MFLTLIIIEIPIRRIINNLLIGAATIKSIQISKRSRIITNGSFFNSESCDYGNYHTIHKKRPSLPSQKRWSFSVSGINNSH